MVADEGVARHNLKVEERLDDLRWMKSCGPGWRKLAGPSALTAPHGSGAGTEEKHEQRQR